MVDDHVYRLEIEFEEYTGSAFAVLKDAFVVRNAILVRVQGLCARRNVSSWDDRKIILVRDESCKRLFRITM